MDRAEEVGVLLACDKNDENIDATGLCMPVFDDDDELDPISSHKAHCFIDVIS